MAGSKAIVASTRAVILNLRIMFLLRLKSLAPLIHMDCIIFRFEWQ